MAQAIWTLNGSNQTNKTSNVTITITDNAGVVEGKEVTATCNGKFFTSLMKRGVCKIYSTEVGTYTITVGEYSTMLVCPYYGQFSTDIYSGVLKVVCTEAGGNNKTCHVQSCDDNYEFTDSYNLTQTFDSSLELTFMGIPTGKYLITVDNKYRFFKEIASIQNINTTDVTLKQWLFNHGDQCLWNTGGWMQCQISNESKQAHRFNKGNQNLGTLSVSQSINFLNDSVQITHHSSAIRGKYPSAQGWGISRINCKFYVGTVKHLPLDISLYKQIVTNSSGVRIGLRSGAVNTAQTTISTPTILATSSSAVFNLNTEKAAASVIIGNEFYDAGYGFDNSAGQGVILDYDYNASADPGYIPAAYSHSVDTKITEVYLT